MAEPYDFSPVCWGWEAPSWEHLHKGVRAQYGTVGDRLAEDKTFLVHEWQGGRCAVCGRLDTLVEDHDHETGLFRGWLCRSCNVREGTNRHTGYRVWREYRERNPASICGVVERYWNPITGEFAKPAPAHDEGAVAKAFRNIGL